MADLHQRELAIPIEAVAEWLSSARDGFGFPLDGVHEIWGTLPGDVRIVGIVCLSQIDGTVESTMTILSQKPQKHLSVN